jgi:ubiquinone biosynthesis monooxygenase Coq7
VKKRHYNEQINKIIDPELKKTITKFRDEELEHKHTALNHNAAEMAGYGLFIKLIKLGTKVSIMLAKKI